MLLAAVIYVLFGQTLPGLPINQDAPPARGSLALFPAARKTRGGGSVLGALINGGSDDEPTFFFLL